MLDRYTTGPPAVLWTDRYHSDGTYPAALILCTPTAAVKNAENWPEGGVPLGPRRTRALPPSGERCGSS